MITRRRVLLAVLALLVVCVGHIAWTLAGLPPVKYHLRYGLDPYCEPTGETVTYEGVTFVEISPGIFRMGSDHLVEGGDWLGKICAPLGLPWGKQPEESDEMPVHWVEFRRGYWIATTEITNAQYERFRPKRERYVFSPGGSTPVVGVSWHGAKEFCAWLGTQAGRQIGLPSEAQWECACRAGSNDEFTFGDDKERLSVCAWFGQEYKSRARAVTTKRPNRWGLFDLHGNVSEWCEDTWQGSYVDAPADGSPWVVAGPKARIYRGGCWYYDPMSCRSAFRWGCHPDYAKVSIGFRPAFSNPEPN